MFFEENLGGIQYFAAESLNFEGPPLKVFLAASLSAAKWRLEFFLNNQGTALGKPLLNKHKICA